MTTIVVSRAYLAAALADAIRIVDRKQIIPILGNVRLQVADARMTVTATDLDIVWRSTFPIDGGLGGEAMDTTVPAIRFSDILKRAAGDTVSLVLDKDRTMTVRAGKARWTLPVLPSVDFPDPESVLPTHSFVMLAADLAAGLAATGYATAGEKEARIMLQGVYMEVRDGKLWFVASDGSRMPIHGSPAPAGAEGFPAMIIPDPVVSALHKLTAGVSGDVTIRGHKERLFVEVEVGGRRVHIATKLVAATYPDWRRLLAMCKSATVYQVDRSMIADAASRVALSAGDKSRCIAIEMSDGLIRLSVRNHETGEEAEDEVEATGEGDALRIGINGTFAAEALAALPAGTIEIRAGNPGEALRFVVPGNEDRTTIVMPMRIPGTAAVEEAA